MALLYQKANIQLLPITRLESLKEFWIYAKKNDLEVLAYDISKSLIDSVEPSAELSEYALLKSQISNASFLTVLYVPIVAIISRFLFNSRLTWIIWITVLICIYGSYLLSVDQSQEVRQSDMLVLLAAFFFAIHIILIDIFLKNYNDDLNVWITQKA